MSSNLPLTGKQVDSKSGQSRRTKGKHQIDSLLDSQQIESPRTTFLFPIPISKSSIMPSSSKKRKHKKKWPGENLPALYVEDIGTEGIRASGATQSTDAQVFRVKVDKKEKTKRQRRMDRFAEQNEKLKASTLTQEDRMLGSALQTSRTGESSVSSSDDQLKSLPENLVGTSTALEKPYMRLTTHPKAENVRPLAVLQKSLSHIKSQFIHNEDFEWANEQLKSVRQDITVQHLRCPFVLDVYETHARILLEHGDLNEFNQCQTMIWSLTSFCQVDSDEAAGKMDKRCTNLRELGLLRQSDESADEFMAYRLLYDLVQHSWADLGRALARYNDNCDASRVRKNSKTDLPSVARGTSGQHALKVVKAVMHNDYKTFFRLYETAPHLSAYLMDFLVRRVRTAAFERIVAAYRPTFSVEHFREVLVFHDLEETRRFLKKSGAVFVNEVSGPAFWVDCKASFALLSQP